MVLLGNKSDLTEKRVISNEIVTAFAESLNVSYYETSAKTGKNLN
jgi:hypothetical protein